MINYTPDSDDDKLPFDTDEIPAFADETPSEPYRYWREALKNRSTSSVTRLHGHTFADDPLDQYPDEISGYKDDPYDLYGEDAYAIYFHDDDLADDDYQPTRFGERVPTPQDSVVYKTERVKPHRSGEGCFCLDVRGITVRPYAFCCNPVVKKGKARYEAVMTFDLDENFTLEGTNDLDIDADTRKTFPIVCTEFTLRFHRLETLRDRILSDDETLADDEIKEFIRLSDEMETRHIKIAQSWVDVDAPVILIPIRSRNRFDTDPIPDHLTVICKPGYTNTLTYLQKGKAFLINPDLCGHLGVVNLLYETFRQADKDELCINLRELHIAISDAPDIKTNERTFNHLRSMLGEISRIKGQITTDDGTYTYDVLQVEALQSSDPSDQNIAFLRSPYFRRLMGVIPPENHVAVSSSTLCQIKNRPAAEILLQMLSVATNHFFKHPSISKIVFLAKDISDRCPQYNEHFGNIRKRSELIETVMYELSNLLSDRYFTAPYKGYCQKGFPKEAREKTGFFEKREYFEKQKFAIEKL